MYYKFIKEKIRVKQAKRAFCIKKIKSIIILKHIFAHSTWCLRRLNYRIELFITLFCLSIQYVT